MAEQTHTTHNPFDELVPATGVGDWAYQARTDLARYIRPLTIRDEVKPYAEAVEKRLRALETAVKVNKVAEGTARAEFIEWLLTNDYGGFLFYSDKHDEEVRAANEAAAKKATDRMIQSARDVAVRTRNGYSGVGNNIGTVVVGMADTVGGVTYVGHSGGYTRAEQQHALMAELVGATKQREDWGTDACAEVDAMNQYLLTTTYTLVSQIPRGKLFFHAETYNWSEDKWQARRACGNCDQWLKRIGAGRV
ncbi:hypothetical protein ABZU32_30235 [Sphaerisporangium sp. NPDC005288]|uniref:hypothetical protein n=1 Tax=Sphaerisporangium sp. NPDC005288 TaxID=3155114 RepID=UPI0033AAE6F3